MLCPGLCTCWGCPVPSCWVWHTAFTHDILGSLLLVKVMLWRLHHQLYSGGSCWQTRGHTSPAPCLQVRHHCSAVDVDQTQGDLPWDHILTQLLLLYPASLSPWQAFPKSSPWMHHIPLKPDSGSASRKPNLSQSPVAQNETLQHLFRGWSQELEAHMSLPPWRQHHNHLPASPKTTSLPLYSPRKPATAKHEHLEQRVPTTGPRGAAQQLLFFPGWISRRQGLSQKGLLHNQSDVQLCAVESQCGRLRQLYHLLAEQTRANIERFWASVSSSAKREYWTESL